MHTYTDMQIALNSSWNAFLAWSFGLFRPAVQFATASSQKLWCDKLKTDLLGIAKQHKQHKQQQQQSRTAASIGSKQCGAPKIKTKSQNSVWGKLISVAC